MKKIIQYFSSLMIALAALNIQASQAQVLGNEWINYSQSYFKIKVGKNGIYRIPQSVLQSNGMGSVTGAQFALYREGQQVPVYVSSNTALAAGDYIEFYGSKANGKMDTELYVPATKQMNDEINIISDSAVYFLTYSAIGGGNARLNLHANVMPTTPPVAEPFCVTTVYPNQDPRAAFSPGETFTNTINFHSAKFDKAEGPSFASVSNLDLIFPTGAAHATAGPTLLTTLYFYRSANGRQLRLRTNNTSSSITAAGALLLDTFVNAYALITKSIPLNQALLGSTSTTYRVQGGFNWFVLNAAMRYNRTFNFAGVNALNFSINGNNQLQLIVFSNLNDANANIVLDLNQNNLYHLSANDSLILELENVERKLFFADKPTLINSLVPIEFRDYTQAINQGSYLILSDNEFINVSNGGLSQYNNYRSSIDGGEFNTVVISANELYNQFGWGYDYHPLGIRRFLRYVTGLQDWMPKPEYMFIVGKGIAYHKINHYLKNRATLDFPIVPTYGDPGSDNLFAELGSSSIPNIAIGRLSVKTNQEILDYLTKVKLYEIAQKVPAYPNIENSLWKKTAMHVAGSTDAANQTTFFNALNVCKNILEDSAIGGVAHTFSVGTTAITENSSGRLDSITNAGLQYITYYGHASSSGFNYNLNTPENINCSPKFPIFLAFGCAVASIFEPTNSKTISEKYITTDQGGAVAMVASTNLGWTGYLDYYMAGLYQKMAKDDYGKTFGKQYLSNLSRMASYSGAFTPMHLQNFLLQGDPGLRIFSPDKPDYFLDETLITTTATDLNTSLDSFELNVKIYNLGLATNDLIDVVVTKRKDGSTDVLYSDTTKVAVSSIKELIFSIPIDKINDVGLFRYTVTLNPQHLPDELSLVNNEGTFSTHIGAKALVPSYPFEYSIVNQQNVDLIATTLSPFGTPTNFIMEVDTNAYFNSPLKAVQNITSLGGVIKWQMPITMIDSTVYYWRTAVDSNVFGRKYWSNSSFIYLPNAGKGWNQSNYFQYKNDSFSQLEIAEPDRLFKGVNYYQALSVQARTFGHGNENDIMLNSNSIGFGSCLANSAAKQGVLFVLIDPITGKAMKNNNQFPGAITPCSEARSYQFEFYLSDSAERRKVMEFVENIPNDYFVVMRANSYSGSIHLASAQVWMDDQFYWGSGVSLYHALDSLGFPNLLQIQGRIPYAGVAQKGNPNFDAKLIVGTFEDDLINLQTDLIFTLTQGYAKSTVIGPATQWQQLQWETTSDLDASPANDQTYVSVWGLSSPDAVGNLLFTTTNGDTSLSAINTSQYPYLQMRWSAKDSITLTMPQLKYWRVLHDELPEAALNPLMSAEFEDTVEVGNLMNFRTAVENISQLPMDSIAVKFKIVNLETNNVTHFGPTKFKPLLANDTAMVGLYGINSNLNVGRNILYIEVNPEEVQQPEQYHPNNLGFIPFYVKDFTLPVSLESFDVHRQGESAILEWITVSEQNCHGFGIEKSPDGKGWNRIGYVNSKSEGGTSGLKLAYNFTDKKPLRGLNYYRLKQTDLDGRYKYSIVRTLRFDNSKQVDFYPNPAKTYVEISGLNGDESIVIFDVIGRKVRELKVQQSIVSVPLDDLSEGIYMINVLGHNGQTFASKKVVKVK